MAGRTTSIAALPEELLQAIFAQLGPRDLGRAQQVSKEWCAAACHPDQPGRQAQFALFAEQLRGPDLLRLLQLPAARATLRRLPRLNLGGPSGPDINYRRLAVRLRQASPTALSALTVINQRPKRAPLSLLWPCAGLTELRHLTILQEGRQQNVVNPLVGLAATTWWPQLVSLCLDDEAFYCADKAAIMASLSAALALPAAPSLRELHLSRLDGASLSALVAASRLRSLTSFKAQLVEDGALTLAAAPWTALQRLDLGGSRIGEAPLTALLNAPLLAEVTHLDLEWVLGRVPNFRFAEQRQPLKLRYLGLASNDLQPAKVLERFGKTQAFIRVKRLNLFAPHCQAPNLGEAQGKQLARVFPALQWLKIRSASFDAAGAAALRAHPALQELDLVLCHNSAGEELSCASLGCVPSLTRLTFDPQMRARVEVEPLLDQLGAAGGLTRLKALTLASIGLLDRQFWALAGTTGLPHLEELDLHNSALSTARAAVLLHHFTGLRRLRLSDNPLGDAGAQVLATPPGLRRLEYLDYRDTGLTDAGAEILAATLVLPALRFIDLSSNKRLSQRGLSALRSATGLLALEKVACSPWPEPSPPRGATAAPGVEKVAGPPRRRTSQVRPLLATGRQNVAIVPC